MQPIPFGRYLLTERLALGGTAEIFKAKLLGIEGFEKTLVIKRILPHWSANSSFISMLIDEAKIMVRLNHERIVQVYELGKEKENYYIAMEYIAGTDLRKLIDRSRVKNKVLKPEEAVFIIIEVLRGLDYIHKQKDDAGKNLKIVHRDISPQNILISHAGAIKIADFGIAHAASRSYETATGVLKGKFAYMSPEQARGAPLNEQTDLFAAGIILYELLSGERLFAGGSDLEVLERVRLFNVEEKLKNLAIEKSLKNILRHALQLNPKDRYANAQEFLKDLQEAQRILAWRYHCDHFAERVNDLMENELPPTKEKETRVEWIEGAYKTPKLDLEITEGSGPLVTRMMPAFIPNHERSHTEIRDENTRLLEEPEEQISPPNPAQAKEVLIPLEKQKPSRFLASWRGLTVLALILSATLMAVYVRYFQKQKDSPLLLYSKSTLPQSAKDLVANSQKSTETLPTLAALNVLEKSKVEKKKPEEKTKAIVALKEKNLKEENEAPVNIKGQGTLSVRASPWGKISIAGIVNGSERPVSKTVAYGNYQVSVAYKGLSGDWKNVSRNVKVAKAATVCNASFRPDGEGAIVCN